MKRSVSGFFGFRIPSFLSGLAADRSGVIIVMFALLLPVILGAIGLGVEVGNWYQMKRSLQTAADAAAIAGAYEVWDGNSETDAYTAALREAERNWSDTFDSSEFDSDVMPPTSGSYTGDTYAVEVEISKTVDLMFLGYLMTTSSVTLNARAVATLGSTGDTACVLSLNSSSSMTTFSISGNATVDLSGCAVAVNGNASSADGGSDALTISGGTTNLTTECYYVAGGVSGSEDITTTCSSGETGSHAVSDPFAYDALDDPLPEPAASEDDDCPSSSASIYNGTDPPAGTYCGLTLKGTVNLSGTYIVRGNNFSVNANAIVTGTDVTIFLTSNDAETSWPSVSISGSSDLDLTAPTSGTYQGILFYQDRDTPVSENTSASFNGGANLDLEGTLYFPSADVSFTGGSSVDSECIQIIAYEVSISGDSYMDNSCSMLSGSGGTTIDIEELTLVE